MQDSKLIRRYNKLDLILNMKNNHPSKEKIKEVKWKHSTKKKIDNIYNGKKGYRQHNEDPMKSCEIFFNGGNV